MDRADNDRRTRIWRADLDLVRHRHVLRCLDNADRVFTLTGTSWSAPLSLATTTEGDAVSPASSTLCLAVDFVGDATTDNGATWSARADVGSGETVPGRLTSVSCPNPTTCLTGTNSGYIYRTT